MVAMEKCEPKYEPRCRIFFAEGQKFRTNLLVLFFDLPLKRETATKTALLAGGAAAGGGPDRGGKAGGAAFWGALGYQRGEKGGTAVTAVFLGDTEKCGNRGNACVFARAAVCADAEWLYGENRGAAEENFATEIGKPKG